MGVSDTALTHTRPSAAEAPQAQQAVSTLLGAAVSAYGDIVQALLCDLGQASESISAFGWLGPTPVMLSREHAYRVATEQLGWWSRFLAPLANPTLLSEQAAPQRRRAQALHARARLLGRQAALEAHRAQVAAALADPALSPEQRDELHAIAAAPDKTAWWVDPQPYIDAASAELPPLPTLIPIVPADRDPAQNAAGARAVAQMRQDATLGPRAQQLDAALTGQLQQLLKLPPEQAAGHARVLTDIFWIALRRALARGQHDLEASLHLLAASEEAPIREQFTQELLVSWFHYLKNIPPPTPRLTIGQRLRRMLGLRQPAPSSARQLTQDD